MPAATCPARHAIATPKGVAAPTTCPLAYCGQPTTARPETIAQAIRSGVPVA